MRDQILSVLAAFVAFSILDLSKAVQKIALEKGRKNRLVGALIWTGATASTTISSFLLLFAVSIGSVLIVGAMGGSGLASLTLFSIFVMKEHVSRRDIVGVAVILIAPVVMALFPSSSSDTAMVGRLFVFAGVLSIMYTVALVVTRKRLRFHGLLYGGFAGALGGLILLFQKISTTDYGLSVSWVSRFNIEISNPFISRAFELLVNPYALTWIALSAISMAVLQFAYRHDQAIRIVPMFAANYILIPVIGGLLSFQEILHPVQWVGIALILCGVALITLKRTKPIPFVQKVTNEPL